MVAQFDPAAAKGDDAPARWRPQLSIQALPGDAQHVGQVGLRQSQDRGVTLCAQHEQRAGHTRWQFQQRLRCQRRVGLAGGRTQQLHHALQRNGVDHVVTVSNWVQLSLHEQLHRGVPGTRLINATNENQCITVAAGLTVGSCRPMLVMQNQGLYNGVNTLRAVCLDAQVKLVFMVGQFGREFANIGQIPRTSRRTMVRIMEPLLESIGVSYLHPAQNSPWDTYLAQVERVVP